MRIFNRLFRKLRREPKREHPLSLQVLMRDATAPDPALLTQALRQYDPTMSGAVFEMNTEAAKGGLALGTVEWIHHSVQVLGLLHPMPDEVLERCIAPSHYGEELKQEARAHRAHMMLYYRGQESDPLEQLIALTAVAGCFHPQGAVVVLNESAHTSFPAEALAPEEGADGLAMLRELPVLLLYAGFVKHEVERVPGVWMRTYGCPLLGLPDLAMHTAPHDFGESTFNTFSNILDYAATSGQAVSPGDTMQFDDSEYVRLRSPSRNEGFLQQEEPLMVVERIRPDEINSKIAE